MEDIRTTITKLLVARNVVRGQEILLDWQHRTRQAHHLTWLREKGIAVKLRDDDSSEERCAKRLVLYSPYRAALYTEFHCMYMFVSTIKHMIKADLLSALSVQSVGMTAL